MRRLKGVEPLDPGSREYVRFLLKEPLLILPGDRFIVRMFSPVVTIGGGTGLDIAAPRRPALGHAASRLWASASAAPRRVVSRCAARHPASAPAATRPTT